ncbi:hypothetical protein C8F01DRAFT_1039527, partial [Mycena amicta]
MTGIIPIVHDMCPNSCMAYTGHLSELEACTECGAPRYDPLILARTHGTVKTPQRTFSTIPIGPVIQNLWRSEEGAKRMRHRQERTAEIRKECLVDGEIRINEYDDLYLGQDYLEAVEEGVIGDDDSVLLFSTDGAQLYAMKQSDCWIYMWVLLDLDPTLRYKKAFVIPGGVIPGKPKVFDSFLFPGLYHLVALMNDG